MSFNFNELPEIYQIEATNACQLKCYMCPRELMHRKTGFLKPKLVELMVEREEFENSYLVELQMYGEPLLNPNLDVIIDILRQTDVKVGFSTNGILLKKKLDTVLKCDYITVSLDADNPETYEKIRPSEINNTYSRLLDGLEELLQIQDRPVVDIQLIDLPENKGQLNNIRQKYGHHPKVVVRTVQDCTKFLFNKQIAYEGEHELCLNPWLSVSIHYNGDVCPCCFWADEFEDDAKNKRFVYGNLYEEPLREIWAKSQEIKDLRYGHIRNDLPDRCMHCSARSPVLLHFRMMMNWFKRGF